MISLAGLVNFVFFCVVAGAIVAILLWVLSRPQVPEPFSNVGKFVVYVAAAFILIWALLGLIGQAPPLFRA